MCAAQGGLHDMVGPLLAAKANIEAANDDGWTALHWACSCGSEAVARNLLLNGAMVAAMTEDGSTPLSLAQEGKHQSLCLLLDMDFARSVRAGSNADPHRTYLAPDVPSGEEGEEVSRVGEWEEGEEEEERGWEGGGEREEEGRRYETDERVWEAIPQVSRGLEAVGEASLGGSTLRRNYSDV